MKLIMPFVMTTLCMFLLFGGYSYAHKWTVLEQNCPVCETTFEAKVDLSGSYADMRLDLKPLGAISAPSLVPVCPKCHFVLYAEEIEGQELEKCKLIVDSKEYKKNSNRASYYLLGLLFEGLQKPPPVTAYVYLQASWQEEAEPEKHKEDLEKSLKYLLEYLRTTKQKDETWQTYQIVAGEIERRLGKFEEAKGRFEELKKMEVFKGSLQEKIITFELDLISRKDTVAHALSEIEEKEEKEKETGKDTAPGDDDKETGKDTPQEDDEKGTDKEIVQDNDKKSAPEPAAKSRKKITNTLGMTFVYIEPTGDNGFMMGSSLSPKELEKRYGGEGVEWYAQERPQHKVILTKGFYLQTTEVTVGQYMKFLNSGGDASGVDFADPDCPIKKSGGRYVLSGNVFGSDEDQPMVEVSWHRATAFCKWLSHKEEAKYRLPTEAEWEYACRAGTKTEFYWGDTMDGKYCWYESNGNRKTNPVGTREPNAWGLYDMSGNASEWCQDWYKKDYYEHSPEKDPQGPPNSEYRVLRGASWFFTPGYCRSASRSASTPVNANYVCGFRIARDPE